MAEQPLGQQCLNATRNEMDLVPDTRNRRRKAAPHAYEQLALQPLTAVQCRAALTSAPVICGTLNTSTCL
jgi:hypothetical protein|uniref:Uncharacterized protein n=1 Tax=viral metagenome TaxID=1070528 RepID=A0A6M3XDH1_9ZZZZ